MINTKNITCPRCLGKGTVDAADIERLNQQLKWKPGDCAYCLGKGKVSKKMASNVPADLQYLSKSTSQVERRRLINKDPNALNRAKRFARRSEHLLLQVNYLMDNGFSNEQIIDFYELESEIYGSQEQQLKTSREDISYVITEIRNNKTPT